MSGDKKIDYIELPAADLDAVERFHRDAFGWTSVPYGPDYLAFNDGGFYRADKSSATNNGAASVILFADDLEGAREIVLQCGGSIVREIFPFPGGGRFHFADRGGNELAVWSDK